MKTKNCPFCDEKMYIYARMGKWICADHARCGYTLDMTRDDFGQYGRLWEHMKLKKQAAGQ